VHLQGALLCCWDCTFSDMHSRSWGGFLRGRGHRRIRAGTNFRG
jgi:hypothetical protein